MENGHYTVKGRCTNCGYKGDIQIRKGERVPREPQPLSLGFRLGGPPVKCPNCDNYACYAR